MSQQHDRLKDLVSHDLRLNQLDGAAIDLDKTTTSFAVRNSNGRLLAAKCLNRLHKDRRESQQVNPFTSQEQENAHTSMTAALRLIEADPRRS